MDGWRVFVGAYDGAWSHVDRVFPDYEQARIALADEIRPFLRDDCTDCREAGTAALSRLEGLAAGSEFTDEIDGEAYALFSSDRKLRAVL